MSNAITWMELVGDTTVDPEEAVKFLEWRFRKDDVVAIRTHGKTWSTWAMPLDMAIDTIRESLEDVAKQVDVYFALNPLKEPFTDENGNYYATSKHGVRKEHVKTWRTLYADIDVKAGSFDNQDDVRRWIESLDVIPGAVVWTQGDKGGCHLYFKTNFTTELDFYDAQEMLWSYLQAQAPEDISVDRLVDVTRVARLPGSTRHASGTEKNAHVTAEYIEDAPVLDRETFDKLVEQPYKETRERQRVTRGSSEGLFAGIEGLAKDSIAGIALRMYLIDRVGEYFTWEEILTEAGWTYYRPDKDGASQWTRPGGEGKSAVVGYTRDDANMSLFSWDQGTGLADLYEIEEPLTMFRVLVRLWFNDDYEAAIKAIMDRRAQNA